MLALCVVFCQKERRSPSAPPAMERARLNVADGADERRRGLENTGMAQDFLVQQLKGFKENNRIFMIFVCWMLDPPRFFAP